MIKYILILLLVSCGSKTKKPTYPDIHSDSLREQIERIMPKLLWCCGMLSSIYSNNKSGQPNCAIGDGMITNGVLFSVNGWPSILKANYIDGVKRSIRADGMPFRNPIYATYPPDENAFSRDQHLGFMHYLVTTHDTELANRYLNYVRNNNWKTCEKDTDGRCNLITSYKKLQWKGSLYLMNDVYTHIGLPEVEHMSFGERELDEEGLLFMARTTPPGYEQHLVSQNVWLRIRLGLLSKSYAESAKVLAKRTPNNLWFQTLSNLVSGGNPAVYEEISKKLIVCMKKWKFPGLHHTFSASREYTICEDRPEGSLGGELVWLALFLQQVKE